MNGASISVRILGFNLLPNFSFRVTQRRSLNILNNFQQLKIHVRITGNVIETDNYYYKDFVGENNIPK